MRYLIKNVVKRNLTFIYQKEYDKVRIECGNTVKESIIRKGTNETVYEVWNVYTKKTVPRTVVRKNSGRKQRGCCHMKNK